MMQKMIRFALISALAACALAATGCSRGSSVDAVPAVGGAVQSFVPFAKGRVKIAEFNDLPSSYGYTPTALTVGRGALWVADAIDQDLGRSAVARVTFSGDSGKVFLYQAGSFPNFEGVAVGPGGALWVTDNGDGQIVKFDSHGAYKTFSGLQSLSDIVEGPDRALWFAEGDAIGKITSNGKISIFALGGKAPNYGTLGIQDITVGPDKALWFTNISANAVGRITTGGSITLYTKGISPGAVPLSITPGRDGALWFTESATGKIGRITTAGKVTEYSRGVTSGEEPTGIAAGPDDAMWFTESKPFKYYNYEDAKIGRISMGGQITEYSAGLTSTSEPTAIVKAPDGDLWFVEAAANKLGRISLK